MRFVTWNCGRGFTAAKPYLLALNPDIACLQEVRPAELEALPDGYKARYVSSHPSKGIAVLYKEADWTVSAPVLAAEMVAAFEIEGELRFRLIAVWPIVGSTETYVLQQHKALEAHQDWLAGSVIMAGDWNSNSRWDPKHTVSHGSLVAKLSALGIESVYHRSTGEAHGQEKSATYFHQYKEDQPFHIDYVFLSSDLMARDPILKIEAFGGEKVRPSDHNLLVLDL